MAYDTYLADRISQHLNSKGIPFEEKKMFGGLAIMVNNKMCTGIIKDELMIRTDPDRTDEVLSKDGCRPMDFAKRPMKGYFNVSPEYLDSEDSLEYWIGLCLEFNPKARSSKKKQ